MSVENANPSDRLMQAIRQNPEGLLLLAAGAALLLRKSPSSPQRPKPRDRSRSSEFKNPVGREQDFVPDFTAGEGLAAAAATSGEFVDGIRRKVDETSSRVVDSVQSSIQGGFSRMLQEQPLALALAGLAAGAAIAGAFPATRLEKTTLGPVGERLTEAAETVGSQLKAATTAAGKTLREATDERGLNVAGLKEVAGEVAETFKSSLKGNKAAAARQTSEDKTHERDPARV